MTKSLSLAIIILGLTTGVVTAMQKEISDAADVAAAIARGEIYRSGQGLTKDLELAKTYFDSVGTRVIIDPELSYMITTDADGQILMWNLKTTPITGVINVHYEIGRMLFSPDSTKAITMNADGRQGRIWNLTANPPTFVEFETRAQ